MLKSFFKNIILTFSNQVMWVRRTVDKVSLLTVGNVTYSGDPRLHVTFQYPNNWRLHINPIKGDDAGLYMCQVSTHPPRVFATNLTVMGK
jgi:cell adhesion molecule 4